MGAGDAGAVGAGVGEVPGVAVGTDEGIHVGAAVRAGGGYLPPGDVG
jgi:hypothetical protein